MRNSTQLKIEIKAWAEQTGHWPRFLEIREKLKSEGMPPGDAWLEAAQRVDGVKWGQPVTPPVDLPHGRLEGEPEKKRPRRPVKEKVVFVEEVLVGGAKGEVEKGDTVKKVATVKVVEWVASNIQVDGVAASDAPSTEAWGMLVWARRSPMNESQFWGSIYAKLLPSRSQIEAEQRYADDGLKVEEMASRLLQFRNDALGESTTENS